MRNITSPRLICCKGALFLVGGLLASLLLWLESPTLRAGLLLAAAVWCFSRAYFFAFYVIEHYIDGAFRYDGVWSAVRYLLRSESRVEQGGPNAPQADA